MPDPKITLDQVRHVAMLSRLALDEATMERLTPQLESILEYVDQLSRLDVSGVEPLAHAAPLHNVLREDVAEAPLPLDKVLQNAPRTDGTFFQVPKILGGDGDSVD